MSTRAIRALRGEALLSNADGLLSSIVEDGDSDGDGNEELLKRRRSAPLSFSILAGTHDSDDDSISEENDPSFNIGPAETDEDVTGISARSRNTLKQNENPPVGPSSSIDDHNVEEDLDALLLEFHEMDRTEKLHDLLDPLSDSFESFPFDFILKSFDPRDLDYDFSMRMSMLHAGSVNERSNRPQKFQSASLFGPPMDGWIRPPRFIGGGIGMATYDSMSDPGLCLLPWPYSNTSPFSSHPVCNETSSIRVPSFSLNRWCTFLFSDVASKDVRDYFSIQQSGDINAVIMFIAHHPYVTEALMQLSNILYQTNHSAEGFSLLHRCLWIYESSSLTSFVSRIAQGRVCFIDKDRKENAVFFLTLFRLFQVSSISGLHRTAFAACRLLLSLDPLRDPLNVLLVLDYHAILVSRDCECKERIDLLQWLVELVEIDIIQIWHRDKGDLTTAAYNCSLLDLPNWAYTYALALFDLHKAIENGGTEYYCADSVVSVKCKADTALQSAFCRFPAVLGSLIRNLNIDTIGRSFHRDWLPVFDKISIWERELVRQWHATSTLGSLVLAATLQTSDLVAKIYLQQCVRLYAHDDVVQWMYDNLLDFVAKEQCLFPGPPNPAIRRYALVDPTDFDAKIQMLPPDANVIDDGLLAHAMIINLNRRRFLQRPHRQDHRHNEADVQDGALEHRTRHTQTSFLGPPSELVDPDWPMLEVFWRSLLPWNDVVGMPPPR